MPPKAWYEVVCRRRLGLPKHSTANDDAVVLLRLAMIAASLCMLACVYCPWFLRRFAVFTTSAFLGLSLQQYAFYTSRSYIDCWTDEGFAVAAVVGISACAIGFISLMFSLLLPSMIGFVMLTVLHGALLTSSRWARWGSLFDGNDKLSKRSL